MNKKGIPPWVSVIILMIFVALVIFVIVSWIRVGLEKEQETTLSCEEKFSNLLKEWNEGYEEEQIIRIELSTIIKEQYPECVCLNDYGGVVVNYGTCTNLTDRTDEMIRKELEAKQAFCERYHSNSEWCTCVEGKKEVSYDERISRTEITCYNKDGSTCNIRECDVEKIDLQKECSTKKWIDPFIKGSCSKAIPR